MHTEEPAFTIEATNRFVKILDITYANVKLKQLVASATQMNAEEITQLLRLLEDFEDLFDGSLGDW